MTRTARVVVFQALLVLGFLAQFTALSFAAPDQTRFLADGQDTATVTPYAWSAYWWPWSGQGMTKCLKKLDNLAKSRTGRDPGAAAWERKHHHSGPEWSGHCNGWSAASLLEPEPTVERRVDGTTFSVGEQKALLTEMYMDCYFQFHGTRAVRSRPVDPDILPHHFHRLLLECLKIRKCAFVIDADPAKQVWNYPVYAFQTSWKVNRAKQQANVTTVLWAADDAVKSEFIGTKALNYTYTYSLQLNPAGEVIGGNWTGNSINHHPDFVWIPTADAPASIWENPFVDAALVREVLGTGPLPPPNAPPVPTPPASQTVPVPDVPPASGVPMINAMVVEAPFGPELFLREAGVDPEAYF